jgi:predicted nucleic acid-binding protein
VITYVETSALIKSLIDEPGSDRAGRIWDGADSLVSVSLVEVEARAALAAADRAGRVTAAQHRQATRSLMDLIEQIEICRDHR